MTARRDGARRGGQPRRPVHHPGEVARCRSRRRASLAGARSRLTMARLGASASRASGRQAGRPRACCGWVPRAAFCRWPAAAPPPTPPPCRGGDAGLSRSGAARWLVNLDRRALPWTGALPLPTRKSPSRVQASGRWGTPGSAGGAVRDGARRRCCGTQARAVPTPLLGRACPLTAARAGGTSAYCCAAGRARRRRERKLSRWPGAAVRRRTPSLGGAHGRCWPGRPSAQKHTLPQVDEWLCATELGPFCAGGGRRREAPPLSASPARAAKAAAVGSSVAEAGGEATVADPPLASSSELCRRRLALRAARRARARTRVEPEMAAVMEAAWSSFRTQVSQLRLTEAEREALGERVADALDRILDELAAPPQAAPAPAPRAAPSPVQPVGPRLSGSAAGVARPGSDSSSAGRMPKQDAAEDATAASPGHASRLRQAAASKLLRRHGSVSAVWRAAHRAAPASHASGGSKRRQAGVTAHALLELLHV